MYSVYSVCSVYNVRVLQSMRVRNRDQENELSSEALENKATHTSQRIIARRRLARCICKECGDILMSHLLRQIQRKWRRRPTRLCLSDLYANVRFVQRISCALETCDSCGAANSNLHSTNPRELDALFQKANLALMKEFVHPWVQYLWKDAVNSKDTTQMIDKLTTADATADATADSAT